MSSERNLSNQFDLLFCGLLLVCFGGSFAVAGFIVVAIGCRGLASESQILEETQFLCFAFALFSSFFVVSLQDLPLVFWIPVAIAPGLFVWRLLGGVAEVAEKHQYPQLAASDHWHRRAFAITTSLAFIVAWYAQIYAAPPLAVVRVALVPVGLVGLSVLHLLYLARWQFSARSQGGVTTPSHM